MCQDYIHSDMMTSWRELKTTAILLTACCNTEILKLYERVREGRSEGQQ